jgi:uncharacterized membrane protein YfcA
MQFLDHLFCGSPLLSTGDRHPRAIAGLLGNPGSIAHLSSTFPLWLAAAIAGGLLGARWGSRIAQPRHLRTVLAAVLAVAVAKLVIS